MPRYTYNRDGTPVGETIVLEVAFADILGNPKDSDSTPTVSIIDEDGTTVRATSATGVDWIGVGKYRLEFDVPDGYTSGTWSDTWTGAVDGYQINAAFNFLVSSIGTITATGPSVVDPAIEIGDDPWPSLTDYSQNAKANINFLLKLLKSRLRSTGFKPDGSKCDLFSNDDLLQFLNIALSEFNLTPTITGFTFDDSLTRTLFADILTQGAMLAAWSGQAILEAGREYTINDNGATIQPPPVSSTISSMFNTQLSDYRNKMKEAKRNMRPAPLGMSGGSLFARQPATQRLRWLKEKTIL